MQQISFIPVKLAHEEPYNGAGRDLSLVGYTSTRIRYAVKRESDKPALALSEWIGYKLCELCNIPTPEYAIVECLSGEIAFGSRWEETSHQITSATGNTNALILLKTHSKAISSIHAVDQFFGNIDRHAGNFLFAIRGGEEMALALDFSRAGPAVKTPFGIHPLPVTSFSMQLVSTMKSRGIFHDSSRKFILSGLARITDADFAAILDAAPTDWFVAISKPELTDWWDNERLTRLSEISS